MNPDTTARRCVTCSDELSTVCVVELLPDGLAIVDTGTATEEISVALVAAAVGQRLLVQAKEAIGAAP